MLTLRTLLAGSLLFVTAAGAQTPSLPLEMQPDTTVSELKSPTKARLLAIIPGVGHRYAGESEIGVAVPALMAGTFVAGLLVAGIDCIPSVGSTDNADCGRTALTESWIVAGGIWVVSIVDAGNAARRTNARRAGRASLIFEPTRTPAARGDHHTAVRLGMRVTVW